MCCESPKPPVAAFNGSIGTRVTWRCSAAGSTVRGGNATILAVPWGVAPAADALRNASGQPTWSSITSSISAMMRMVSFEGATIFW